MPNFFVSSKEHRPIQRGTGMLEIMNGGASSLDPRASIPIKFMQTLLAGRSLFNSELQAHERMAQGLQFSLAATSLAILITLLFVSTSCENTTIASLTNHTQSGNTTANSNLDFTLCTVSLLLDLLYKGVLLATWAPGEVAKEKKENTNNSPANLGQI